MTNESTKSKWTGGEWAAQKAELDDACKGDDEYGYCDIHAPGFPFGNLVARAAGRTLQEAQANAHLLAAAPKLFEACERAANSVHHPTCRLQKGKSLNCNCAVGACQAALSLALGEGE